MKTFLIVRRSDMSIQSSYQAEEKDDSSANRSFLMAEPICAHLELPQNLEADEVTCELQDNQMVLVHDAEKAAAKLEKAWNDLRGRRDALLWESDKYMLADYPISSDKKAEVISYRNALRDLPTHIADPRMPVEWPTPPEI